MHEINLRTGAHSPLSAFETKASNIVISSDRPNEAAYLYMAVEGKIEVANLQGNVTRSLPLAETEGSPVHLDVHGVHLVASSTRGVIRLWDLSKSNKIDAKLARAFENERGKIGQITALCVNKNGTRIAILSRPLPVPCLPTTRLPTALLSPPPPPTPCPPACRAGRALPVTLTGAFSDSPGLVSPSRSQAPGWAARAARRRRCPTPTSTFTTSSPTRFSSTTVAQRTFPSGRQKRAQKGKKRPASPPHKRPAKTEKRPTTTELRPANTC